MIFYSSCNFASSTVPFLIRATIHDRTLVILLFQQKSFTSKLSSNSCYLCKGPVLCLPRRDFHLRFVDVLSNMFFSFCYLTLSIFPTSISQIVGWMLTSDLCHLYEKSQSSAKSRGFLSGYSVFLPQEI